MKSYYGYKGLCKYLGVITGEQFQEEYNKYADSPDKRAVASTIHPVETVDPKTQKPLIQAWIFYEFKEENNKTFNNEGQIVEEKKEMML